MDEILSFKCHVFTPRGLSIVGQVSTSYPTVVYSNQNLVGTAVASTCSIVLPPQVTSAAQYTGSMPGM